MKIFEGITADYELMMACEQAQDKRSVTENRTDVVPLVTIAERRRAHTRLVSFTVVQALGLSTFSEAQPIATDWSQVGAYRRRGVKTRDLKLEARLSVADPPDINSAFPSVNLDLRGKNDPLLIEEPAAFRFDTTEWLAKRHGPYGAYLPLEPGDAYWRDVETVLNRMVYPNPTTRR